MTSQSQAEHRAFLCPHCSRPAGAVVRGRAEYYDPEKGPPVEWRLVQCDTCHQPTLEVRENFGRGFDDDTPGTVYPVPHRLSPAIPTGLRREWEEAQTCFDAKAYAAAVVMVRRTLEGT